jgi:diketogulonate reductase-like aldo/keto reductase
LGTGKRRDAQFIYQAISIGYRHIDTAAPIFDYDEAATGEAVERAILTEGSGLERSDFFLQTRYPLTGPTQQHVDSPGIATCQASAHMDALVSQSLSSLRVEYIDCVFLNAAHGSAAQLVEAWKALETHVPHRVRRLGLSNVDPSVLRHFLGDVSLAKVFSVQNRFYWLNKFDGELRDLCSKNGIVYQAFGVLTGNRTLLSSMCVRDVARSHNLSEQQALMSLVSSLGNDCSSPVIVLNGSGNYERLADDLIKHEAISDKSTLDGFQTCMEQVTTRLSDRYERNEY